jgi:hypothetical protein
VVLAGQVLEHAVIATRLTLSRQPDEMRYVGQLGTSVKNLRHHYRMRSGAEVGKSAAARYVAIALT